MESTRKWLYVGVLAAVSALVILTLWKQEQYLLFSLLIILLAMIPFFYRFERREIEAEEIVLVAMLAAIAAISRAAFVIAPP